MRWQPTTEGYDEDAALAEAVRRSLGLGPDDASADVPPLQAPAPADGHATPVQQRSASVSASPPATPATGRAQGTPQGRRSHSEVDAGTPTRSTRASGMDLGAGERYVDSRPSPTLAAPADGPAARAGDVHIHLHVAATATAVGGTPSAAETTPAPGGRGSQPEDEPGPASQDPGGGGSPDASAGPAHRDSAGRVPAGEGDVRVYAVWHVPGRPDAPGIYTGRHPACWDTICEMLPGHQYIGSGAHLRRYASVEEAQAAWFHAAPRRHRPGVTPAPVFEVL